MNVTYSNLNQVLTQYQNFMKNNAANADALVGVNGLSIGANSTGDHIGKAFRSEKMKAGNDEIRSVTLAAISKSIGGRDPRVVFAGNANFKWQDFGKGKPLSQRRLTAMWNEVNKFVSKNDTKPTKFFLDTTGEKIRDEVKFFQYGVGGKLHEIADSLMSHLKNSPNIVKDNPNACFDMRTSITYKSLSEVRLMTGKSIFMSTHQSPKEASTNSEILGMLMGNLMKVANDKTLPPTERSLANEVLSVLNEIFDIFEADDVGLDRASYEKGLVIGNNMQN